ncbi:uncharacterized protein LOC126974227 [Leptidea sinapis]|uniref:uncharacterized protein LOC126974227 n=1 Tax=Leptidea sinapis TaxID=189913 RepID=UPI0021C41E56|nr:uncharacterized protein LOC126974227 [Leptidea sinapis]XP_050677647.1 uncharacterized protein LOC126974227 [Leptidea sinapis]
MGQEQSLGAHTSVAPIKHYQHKYDTKSSLDLRITDYERNYRHKGPRKSVESLKSDISTESSGYRSGSSAYEQRSDVSCKTDYNYTSLYKNSHYKDLNKELYKPVKIKEKRNKLTFYDESDDIKSTRIRSYLSDTEKLKLEQIAPKKAGIRNYTPKIISAEEQTKKTGSWN